MAPRTLNDLFFDAAARFGTRPVAFRIKREGAWTETSWPTFFTSVQQRVDVSASYGGESKTVGFTLRP